MKLPLHLRTIGHGRRLQVVAAEPIESPAATVAAHRHPAMRGLDVSPVHGHHCICRRCDADRPSAA